MASFAPPADTRDLSGKFISFCKAKLQHHQSDPLENFVQRWGLNEDAVHRLKELPVELQFDVMNSFAPPQDTRNVSARFISFAKARVQQQEVDPLEAFAKRWGLNEDAMRWLRSMPVDQQSEAMAAFAPTPDTRNTSARFISFAKGKMAQQEVGAMQAASVANVLERFCQSWGLNEDAMARLRDLPPELQQETMCSFAPPPGTRDSSAKFIAFAKVKRLHYEGGEQPPRAKRPRMDTPPEQFAAMPALIAPPVQRPAAADGAEDFVQHWGLNEDALARLIDLPVEVQQEVMASFSPPADTRDVSAKFISFTRAKRTQFEQAGPLQHFAGTWGLNEDAVRELWELPPGLRAEAMGSFAPAPNTRDVSAKFITFARRKRNAAAGVDAGNAFNAFGTAVIVPPRKRPAPQWDA
uniref:Uncharacterized protein n=1 Tax=Alexandrium catenella TaxID=2925 RepID=A0A7S1W647_ALECA